MNQSRLARLRQHWPLFCLILLILPLLIFRLTQAPFPWYDEGLNINAAQTLAQTGIFGLTTGTGIRLADPAIQTGPPLIFLMSIIGKVFDNNLIAIRIIMVGFGILLLISLYALVYRMYGRFAALLAALMLITMPPTDTTSSFIMLSRQFLGEVPAIFFISIGCHLLLHEYSDLRRYLLAGFFWGLALTIKSQVFLVLSVTVAIWVLYRIATQKEDRYVWLALALMMYGVYGVNYKWQQAMAGSMLPDNLAVLSEGVRIHILPMRALKNLTDFGVVSRLLVAVFTFGLLWYFTKLARTVPAIYKQQPARVQTLQNFIVWFASIWIFWFAFISIGWARYSFVGIIFAFLILAGILSAIWSMLKLPTNAAVYAVLIAVGVAASLVLNLKDISQTTGDDFFQMVADMKTHIPADARIVSLEWALDNFVPQQFIFPSTHTINVITKNVFIEPVSEFDFDSLADCPQYILLGSLSVDVTILQPALQIAKAEPLLKHGIYQLYEIDVNRLPATCANGT